MFGEERCRKDTNRTRPVVASRSRGDLHIPRFSISVRASVPHLAFRGKYYTLAAGSTVPFPTDICLSRQTPAIPRIMTIFQQTCATALLSSREFPFPFLSFFLFFFFLFSTMIPRPKFTVLTMNFHAKLPTQAISLMTISHARFSSRQRNDSLCKFFHADCRWNWRLSVM